MQLKIPCKIAQESAPGEGGAHKTTDTKYSRQKGTLFLPNHCYLRKLNQTLWVFNNNSVLSFR